ncbi:MAG: hypothetical protein J5796_05295 [Erysipelotrichaceae bacterium]|nr:hypothetical protein [Erysipelotrichaceae bacterium]
MKKLLAILIVLLALTACGRPADNGDAREVSVEDLTIVTPKGAPVLAFYDQIGNENYTRVAADAIGALWTGDNSPDVMVVDLSSGVNAIKNGAEYKLAAIITFGNFYVGSTGHDDDGVMNEGDTVVLFGNENMLPNKIWHYLYGTDFDENLVYEADAQSAAADLISGKDLEGNDVDYVFLAQPALFVALKKNENASLYADIQEEYRNKSGLDMIQAAVFVRNDVPEETVSEFLSRLETSINAAIENPELAAEGLSVYTDEEATAQYGFNPAVVVNVFKQKNALGINAMGLGYKKAIDIKADIDAFLSVLGLPETSEEIYVR